MYKVLKKNPLWLGDRLLIEELLAADSLWEQESDFSSRKGYQLIIHAP